jgi:hypothetical protein
MSALAHPLTKDQMARMSDFDIWSFANGLFLAETPSITLDEWRAYFAYVHERRTQKQPEPPPKKVA